MELDDVDSEAEPACDLCRLPLELKSIDIGGHPGVELVCLVHGRQQLWEPHADN